MGRKEGGGEGETGRRQQGGRDGKWGNEEREMRRWPMAKGILGRGEEERWGWGGRDWGGGEMERAKWRGRRKGKRRVDFTDGYDGMPGWK